jgi:Esterase-like activity of phytase/Bacterial Ig domain
MPAASRPTTPRRLARRAAATTVVLAAAALAGPLTPGQAHAGNEPAKAAANAYTYSAGTGGALSVDAAHGLLAGDSAGSVQLLVHSQPQHGSLQLNPDGSFRYVPAAGFTGQDSFTYTVSNAVSLYSDHLAPMGSYGNVQLNAGSFGSAVTMVPGHSDEVYGLEDRGPNVAAPNGDAIEPIPDYDPAIGQFKLDSAGRATLIREIPLTDHSGHPYSGRVNTDNPTGETTQDLSGHALPPDPNGYDPEGLVALPDGTFWVSDEYGPFITHFDASGRTIQRLSPKDGTLPKELLNRVANRGMEGLTVTPDGKTLVGLMQSGLQQSDLDGEEATKIAPTRIVTYDLQTHALHEYLYLLHDPDSNGTANSEITALSNTTFLVDERDSEFPKADGYKRLWKIDLSGATDVGPSARVPGATYDATKGLLVGGKTIEALSLSSDGDPLTTADALSAYQGLGIKPVAESQYLDLDSMLASLDPNPVDGYSRFFSHDKVEGVAALDGGKTLIISNDNDFGISDISDATPNPPYNLEMKVSPATGQQDNGEFLRIDMTKLTGSAAATSTATATINVG